MAFQKRGSEKRDAQACFRSTFVKFRVTRTVRRRWYRLCQPISILATHRHVYMIPRERFNRRTQYPFRESSTPANFLSVRMLK